MDFSSYIFYRELCRTRPTDRQTDRKTDTFVNTLFYDSGGLKT